MMRKSNADKIREKYGPDYFVNLGRKGGRAKIKKGFAVASPEKRKIWAAKGGRKSKRTKSGLGD